jgi:metal-responsive CopG/Arc/MetJ family transcriptional regulator
MAVYHLMGVLISKRRAVATNLQDVLTRHGCLIKVRLGLHETGDLCSEEGLMILQLNGSDDDIDELFADLNALDGVLAKTIQLTSENEV